MTTIISKSYSRREWQTVILLGLIALLMIGYIFLTYRGVFQAVGKRETNREIAVRQNEVTNLEARALALDNSLTMELAYARGFQDSDDQTFYTVAQRWP